MPAETTVAVKRALSSTFAPVHQANTPGEESEESKSYPECESASDSVPSLEPYGYSLPGNLGGFIEARAKEILEVENDCDDFTFCKLEVTSTVSRKEERAAVERRESGSSLSPSSYHGVHHFNTIQNTKNKENPRARRHSGADIVKSKAEATKRRPRRCKSNSEEVSSTYLRSHQQTRRHSKNKAGMDSSSCSRHSLQPRRRHSAKDSSLSPSSRRSKRLIGKQDQGSKRSAAGKPGVGNQDGQEGDPLSLASSKGRQRQERRNCSHSDAAPSCVIADRLDRRATTSRRVMGTWETTRNDKNRLQRAPRRSFSHHGPAYASQDSLNTDLNKSISEHPPRQKSGDNRRYRHSAEDINIRQIQRGFDLQDQLIKREKMAQQERRHLEEMAKKMLALNQQNEKDGQHEKLFNNAQQTQQDVASGAGENPREAFNPFHIVVVPRQLADSAAAAINQRAQVTAAVTNQMAQATSAKFQNAAHMLTGVLRFPGSQQQEAMAAMEDHKEDADEDTFFGRGDRECHTPFKSPAFSTKTAETWTTF